MWVSLLRAGFCLLVPAAIAVPGLLPAAASRAAVPPAVVASVTPSALPASR